MVINFSKVLLFWNINKLEIIQYFFYSLGYLILLPSILGLIIAVPLSLAIAKKEKLNFLIQIFNFIGSIPSMIMFLILITLGFGIGLKPSLIALIIYATIPILTSLVPTLQSIDSSKRLALNMTRLQSIIYIEIPMSSPQLVNGLKMSLIYGVSNSILCSSIGTIGLGKYIMIGLAQFRFDMCFIGTVPLLILVILFEYFGTKISTRLSNLIRSEI